MHTHRHTHHHSTTTMLTCYYHANLIMMHSLICVLTRSVTGAEEDVMDLGPSQVVMYGETLFSNGGVTLQLDAEAAKGLHTYLCEVWTCVGLKVKTNRGRELSPFHPFIGYVKTKHSYNKEVQMENTVRIPNTRLGKAFEHIPHLKELVTDALEQVCNVTNERDLEVYDLHILRQFPDSMGGAGFGAHRDQHDGSTALKSELRYTCVVKLSEDPVSSPPSAMHVKEPAGLPVLCYPPQAGGSILFRSQDLHDSEECDPRLGKVLKLTIFLRRAE